MALKKSNGVLKQKVLYWNTFVEASDNKETVKEDLFKLFCIFNYA